jgi:hypothetical protein
MSEESLNRLQRAGELTRDALECVEQSTRIVLVTNDVLREALSREIRGIKLSLSLMSRELTALATIVNRRRPGMKAAGSTRYKR